MRSEGRQAESRAASHWSRPAAWRWGGRGRRRAAAGSERGRRCPGGGCSGSPPSGGGWRGWSGWWGWCSGPGSQEQSLVTGQCARHLPQLLPVQHLVPCPASASPDLVSTLKYLCYQFIQQFELKIRSPKPEPKNIPWIPGAAADSRAKIKLEPSQRLCEVLQTQSAKR